MAYALPVFNIFADVWNDGNTPASGDPDVENLPVQKYLYSRGVWDIHQCDLETYTPPIMLRMSVDDTTTWENGQVFEVPPESGAYYRARFKEVMHEGFPNQYLVAVVVQCTAEGIPLIKFIEDAEPCEDLPPMEGMGEPTMGIDISESDGGGFIAAP